jgi:hypothetical protein
MTQLFKVVSEQGTTKFRALSIGAAIRQAQAAGHQQIKSISVTRG